MDYAKRKGITVLGNYIDRALSAKTDNRPEFLRMIKDSGKHLFDVIIVWKLDRFARNRYDSAHYKAILKKHEVHLLSAKENIAEDSSGILMESLLEGMAEYYSVELSEKVVRGMTENAIKCKYNGGVVPVGYTIDKEKHYQIDPITAPLVVEAFTKYSEGMTIKTIAEFLNSKGVQTGYTKPMNINNVTNLLKNRRYIGEYHYRDVVTPGGVPAIVPQDLFDRVQERMEKNRRAPARFKAAENYLLTTKLHCGLCGSFMVGECGRSHTSKTYFYYKCISAKKRKGCKKKAVKKAWIENLVVDQTIKMLMDNATVDYIADLVMDIQGKENTNLPLLRQQLSEAKKGIENMLNAIQQGVLTSSTKQRLEELELRKSDLEVSLLQEEIVKPMLTREQVIFYLHKFRDTDVADEAQRQRLIDSFVNSIYLFDDKIVFTLNYKYGAKTVLLSDILGSDLVKVGQLGAAFCAAPYVPRYIRFAAN